MEKLHSEGKCLFCEETFAKAGISRHLNTHLKSIESKNTKGKSFHIRVEAAEMFLNIWVDGKAKLIDIDDLLREIWLECCGHLSSFTDVKKRANSRNNFFGFESFLSGKFEDDESGPGEIPKKTKTQDVFYKDMIIEYEYDFGSTTQLKIKVLEEFSFRANSDIVLLSRNEPLEILCEICHKEPAVKICSVCISQEEALFCSKCAKKHGKTCNDFDEYASMPIVNSPRMGVCGYGGGSIDVDRDGVFKKKA
ncbi:MAG: hypothetical protein A2046_06360 [Bacteroidetes bacterium GWA2_30_7]|nr:MAG: hypothetical protein A2046_06360 [Bacteroidetes bacterium GWA2_30_7]